MLKDRQELAGIRRDGSRMDDVRGKVLALSQDYALIAVAGDDLLPHGYRILHIRDVASLTRVGLAYTNG